VPSEQPGKVRAERMDRDSRSLAVWATLAAYGRAGYRSMIERHVALAQRLAGQIHLADDFELLSEPRLNVVGFRLARGFDSHILRELLAGNWARTVAITIHAVLVLWMLRLVSSPAR
jgi:glutamate/tyrosine decarboxylase-like PLP-dependent enzyme